MKQENNKPKIPNEKWKRKRNSIYKQQQLKWECVDEMKCFAATSPHPK